MNPKHKNEIKAIIALSLSILILISFISYTPEDLGIYTSHPNIPVKNWARSFGAWVSGVLFLLFGFSAYLLPLVLIFWGIRKLKYQNFFFGWLNIIGFLILTLSLSTFIGIIYNYDSSASFYRGGFFGWMCSLFLVRYSGTIGAYLISFTVATLSFYLVTDFSVLPILRKLRILFKTLSVGLLQYKKYKKKDRIIVHPAISPNLRLGPSQGKTDVNIKSPFRQVLTESKPTKQPRIDIKPPSPPTAKYELKPAVKVESESAKEKDLVSSERTEKEGIKEYKLPSLELLDSPPPLSMRHIKDDLQNNALILEETLGDFGIGAKVTDIERGPVITRYELEPAPGVKVQKITALSDDIALTMKASSVRIVAPIPGKARVGIEVPNTQSSIVYLREIFSSDKFTNSNSLLTLALGKDIAGNPVVTDLADMPHLLIAGTTGSGKTVCVNCLITSIIYRARPDEVKFLMVDPKMVELMPFNGIPHLLCPVVTDPKKVSFALTWVVKEMEERYNIFAQEGCRNINIYNEKREDPLDKMSYIVVIIDELADLMAIAASQIENAITRLAQLSRAVGIHLILATQRPSVDVVTGVIKANFPARISFKVASKVDSRTVLDMNGADKLLGRGDMLFLKPGESKLIRAQGSLIADKEIERIVEFIRSQSEPVYNEEILKKQQKADMVGDFEKDELFDEAVRIILESNQASVSILQRRLRLGYTRAARLIDSIEQEGIIGAFEGSKPRRILVDREAWIKETIAQQTENT